MIPIVEHIKVGEQPGPNGKMISVYVEGKTVGLIRTANELSKLFNYCVFAELVFKKENRPELAERAVKKQYKYFDQFITTWLAENGKPVGPTNVSEFLFSKVHDDVKEILRPSL
jgi:hypothetical protein